MVLQPTTLTSTLLNLKQIHIEVSSKCTLKCPRCPRTELKPELVNRELSLLEFQRAFTSDILKDVHEITFCGDIGDPIYAKDFLEIVRYIKSARYNTSLIIVTNGSYKDTKFWHNLCARLTNQDWIVFSIDGLEHNNHLYRKNSDWKSIIEAVQIVSSYSVNLGWKTLIFDYNYKEINQIKMLAESYGAVFTSEKTGRFGDESLRPPDNLTDSSTVYFQGIESITKIEPQCQQHSKEYISADGYYWPCCWISSAFTLYKSDLWKNKEQWSIKNKNLSELRRQLDLWINSMQTKPDTICKMMCKVGNSTSLKNHGLIAQ